MTPCHCTHISPHTDTEHCQGSTDQPRQPFTPGHGYHQPAGALSQSGQPGPASNQSEGGGAGGGAEAARAGEIGRDGGDSLEDHLSLIA